MKGETGAMGKFWYLLVAVAPRLTTLSETVCRWLGTKKIWKKKKNNGQNSSQIFAHCSFFNSTILFRTLVNRIVHGLYTRVVGDVLTKQEKQNIYTHKEKP